MSAAAHEDFDRERVPGLVRREPAPVKAGCDLCDVEVICWTAERLYPEHRTFYRNLAAIARHYHRWLWVQRFDLEDAEIPLPSPLTGGHGEVHLQLQVAAKEVGLESLYTTPAMDLILQTASGELDAAYVGPDESGLYACVIGVPKLHPAIDPAPALPPPETPPKAKRVTDQDIADYAAVLRSMRCGPYLRAVYYGQVIQATGLSLARVREVLKYLESIRKVQRTRFKKSNRELWSIIKSER